MRITKSNATFEREPLVMPFGFKGAYVTEAWQSIVGLGDAHSHTGIGLGTQGVLWSDASVFAAHSEAAGNAMMFLTTAFALNAAKAIDWETPLDLLDKLLAPTFNYAKLITGNPQLRLTFALNALVAVDNAAWMLYSQSKNTQDFDQVIPREFQSGLSYRNTKLTAIPLVTYAVSIDEICRMVADGCFFLKIKIGCDPDKDGDPEKMLAWDKQRLRQIHEAVGHIETPYSQTGHIPYYLDANGRYDTAERLMRLLDHAKKIGALDRILILEEPFAEENEIDVKNIPVRIAADESAHSDREALSRIDLGYSAIALKPIAKTLSMSLRVLRIAHQHHIPCFCADLTVNPILVDWNKNVAARLAPLPGMKIGILETNGHQYYKNWEQMKCHHPCAGAAWTKVQGGIITLDEDFYRQSGGIFKAGPKYRAEQMLE